MQRPSPIPYATPPLPGRRRPRAGDWGYAVLVGVAYAAGCYGWATMPGGTTWSIGMATANVILCVTVALSALLCFLGLYHVLTEGRRNCPWIILLGTIASGLLPPAILLFPMSRLLQANFS